MVNFVHLAGWLDHEKHGFPGNSRVKDPPASAGDTGSIPGPGTKIPRAMELLGLWATATEPALGPMLHNQRSHCSEPHRCSEEWPPLVTTGESPRTATKTQLSQ